MTRGRRRFFIRQREWRERGNRRTGGLSGLWRVLIVGFSLVWTCKGLWAQGGLDAELLRRFIPNWIEHKQAPVYMPDAYQPGADTNGDGVVDYRDAVVVVETALGGPPVVSERAKVLPDDGSVKVDVISDRRVRLSGRVPELRRDDVIVTTINGGLLRKVDSVARQPDGSLLVETSPTGLAQIIEHGAFQVGFVAPPDAPVIWAEGVKSQQVRPQTLGAGINLGGITLSASGAARVRITEGWLYFLPRIGIGGEFDNGSLEEFHVTASGSFDAALGVRFENATGELSRSVEKHLCTVPLTPFPIILDIGGIPVSLWPKLEFSAGFELTSTDFRVMEHRYHAHLQAVLGAKYEHGDWSPIREHKVSGGMTICELDVRNGWQVVGRLYIQCRIVVYVCEVVGCFIGMTPYVSGELTIPPRGQTYRACLGLGASCDVGVALSIFDIAESSWSTSLVDVNVPLGCVEGSWSGAVFPPRVYLSAEDFWIPQGGSTKLHWSSTNATRVVRSSFGTTELEGVLDVAPTATTEYEITVEGLGGQASARTVVVVGDDTGEGRDSKGPTTLVSAPGTGEKANRASFAPSVSPDGRYVAFESDATNLVDEDTNAARDIFVYDQLGGRSGG